MKLKTNQIQGFLRNPDETVRGVLVFGPDEGLVRERAVQLAKTVLEDLSDPFRVLELTARDLQGDPARLVDEAAAMAFGGGRRVIRVRGATDKDVGPAVENLLKHDGVIDALVLIEAGDLTPKSAMRKKFEAAKDAVAIPCYADDARSLPEVIRQSLNDYGLQADRAAMSLLSQSLGADRSVTRNELEKLALYMGDETMVSEADVRAVIADASATHLDDCISAAATGNTQGLDHALARLYEEAVNPVQIVRSLQRHFHRLHQAAGAMATGRSAEDAMGTLRPPVFFQQKASFGRQLQLWTMPKLARALELLTQAEIDCKTTGYPAETLLSRTLLQIATAAKKPNRR